MRLVAIDPGSNRCGLAFFTDGVLIDTQTLITSQSLPLTRRLHIADQLSDHLKNAAAVASEEPLLMGRNNNFMQRLLGMIEFMYPRVAFFHPMTLKKYFGSGKLDKLELALAVGERLKTEREKEIIADIIAREAFDESDAVAVGLIYLGHLEGVKE